MSEDARFEDAPAGAARPLRLRAESAEDLAVISSLMQDAVGRAGEITWMRKKRRLVVIANRFRWENGVAPGEQGKPLERIRSMLAIEGVMRVRARGLSPKRREEPYELLALMFEPGDGCGGVLRLTMAGGAELAVEVECLELSMTDVSEPWPARARRAPHHPAG